MVVTDRDVQVLCFVARYYAVSAAQIQQVCFPQDKDGRITRRRLASLFHAKLLNRAHMEVFNPDRGGGMSVYFPAKSGCDLLAVRLRDDRFLRTPTQCPQWQNLVHFVKLAELHLTIDAAIVQQAWVKMPQWFNEFDTVNPESDDPAERYQLYTLIRKEPKLVCVPDAAFLLQVEEFKKAHYVELETGSNSPYRAAAEKMPGYTALDQYNLHKKHFPDALDSFSVLVFAPDVNWRDALRRAFRKKQAGPFWKFAAMTELKPETFLHEPIFYPAADGEPKPLVKPVLQNG